MTTTNASNGSKNLTQRIVIAMIAGIITGALLQQLMPDGSDFVIPLYLFDFSLRGFLVDGVFEAVGQIFVASLRMLVVPLVFVSLVCGVCSLKDTAKLGRIGGKAVGLYLLTTVIAVSMAIAIALLTSPGAGVDMVADTTFTSREAPSLAQVFIDMFPSNPFAAFAEGKMLQVIVFALLFGIAMALAGKAGERLTVIFQDLNEVIMRLVTILMNLAPYGVFCLLAGLFTDISLATFGNLIKYFVVVIGVLLIHGLLVYPVLLKLFTGLSPKNLLTQNSQYCNFWFFSIEFKCDYSS